MMVSDVFFVDMRAKQNNSLLIKLERLIDKVGFDFINPKDLVAIKLHFGEQGNTAYIRPQFIRRVVNKVKEKGGKPFLTDANTLYVGSRSNAVDHLQTAIENGFPYAVVDAPLVIADGLTGKDYVNVPVNLKHFKEVKIGAAVHHADALIAVSHVKGHEATGFGGCLKNIGMGSGSRSGKQMMHSDLLPKVDPEKCAGCARCQKWCPGNAIQFLENRAVINEEACIGCGECTVTCPIQAIGINWKTEANVIQEKIVEYVYGILQQKQGKAGFINFVMGVTPDCDCCSWSDAPIVGDVGILASRDPVALDQASIDLINSQPALPGTRLDGQLEVKDKFRAIHTSVDWNVQLEYGEKIGLGSRKYNLIKVG